MLRQNYILGLSIVCVFVSIISINEIFYVLLCIVLIKIFTFAQTFKTNKNDPKNNCKTNSSFK